MTKSKSGLFEEMGRYVGIIKVDAVVATDRLEKANGRVRELTAANLRLQERVQQLTAKLAALGGGDE